MTEHWKEVIGHPGYEVSDMGRVRSVARVIIRCDGVSVRYKGRVLKPQKQKSGHLILHLTAQHREYVHVSVLNAFVGPCPPHEECRHLDGTAGNNVLGNLEWATAVRNKQDQKYHLPPACSRKLSVEDVRAIKRALQQPYVGQLAALGRQYNVQPPTIGAIKYGRTHTDVQP